MPFEENKPLTNPQATKLATYQTSEVAIKQGNDDGDVGRKSYGKVSMAAAIVFLLVVVGTATFHYGKKTKVTEKAMAADVPLVGAQTANFLKAHIDAIQFKYEDRRCDTSWGYSDTMNGWVITCPEDGFMLKSDTSGDAYDALEGRGGYFGLYALFEGGPKPKIVEVYRSDDDDDYLVVQGNFKLHMFFDDDELQNADDDDVYW